MKRKIICLMAVAAMFAVGCNEVDDGNHVDPISIYEKIGGQWDLMNLKMVDEAAKANAIEPNEENLSGLFNYENFKIRFNVDSNNQPTTYEVMGDVPPLFALNGYWQLSSAFQQPDATAVRILLYSDAAKTQQTDELRLTSVPGTKREMEIQLVRVSNGTPFISYIFKLAQN